MITAVSFAFLGIAGAGLAWIDLRRGIIPNWLNLALAVAGLVRSAILNGGTAAFSAAAQAVIVGAVIWLLRRLYFILRQVQGLGLGDVKLLAASTIWIGIVGVPTQLLIASLSALAAAGAMQFAGKTMTRQTSLPFGPFLVLGLVFTLALQQADWID
ncbi:A24 family peptidase [Bradyrhizobium sp. DN5]|uniref:prepilin peptidase n=1 Tax=Bradyrhizobium sp. DN5 TaxID=3056950 RepID=UPI003524103D